jgi:HPt (histidine-containing phosphotransfer) domain-containing protein
MADELDLSRLAELRELLDSELPQIVETLVEELTRALQSITVALADGDLAAAALAAHAARNSALMIDARPLLDCLDGLESSARRDDAGGAREAQRRLETTWPPLCAQLRRAAAQAT